jgi:GNAT superfamily N-acetyltransferase
MREKLEPAKEKAFRVESATPDVAAGIAHVRNMTWLATYPNKEAGVTQEDILAKNFENEDQVQRWRKTIESTTGERKLWVAKDGGIVIGYSQGKKGSAENEILGLYVLPEYQGKGLGGKLLKEALDWLGDEKPVSLTVATYSPAIQVYKKYGFIETDDAVSGPTFDSGARIPTIKMIKVNRGE